MNRYSDDDLMARCVRGDRRAMDILVSRYHSKLLDFAFRHLSDRELAADVAQKTLLKVFERAAAYKVSGSFKAWLYTIALNAVRDEWRRVRSQREAFVSELPEQGLSKMEAEHPAESAEQAVLGRGCLSAVWQAVGELPESRRTALILKFRQELTYDEIAEVMGVPSGTVKSWIHYALKQLKKTLDPCEV